jgi:hypothetical protein
MTEQYENNLQSDDEKRGEKSNDEFIPGDARPICPKCLTPCHPLQNYCENCDSNEVINPLASYMPFVRIRFNIGMFCKMWRKIWYDKDTSIKLKWFYLFMIVAFTPILIIVGLPLLLIGAIPEPKLRKTTVAAFYIIAVLLLVIFIYFGLFRGAISPVIIY